MDRQKPVNSSNCSVGKSRGQVQGGDQGHADDTQPGEAHTQHLPILSRHATRKVAQLCSRLALPSGTSARHVHTQRYSRHQRCLAFCVFTSPTPTTFLLPLQPFHILSSMHVLQTCAALDACPGLYPASLLLKTSISEVYG